MRLIPAIIVTAVALATTACSETSFNGSPDGDTDWDMDPGDTDADTDVEDDYDGPTFWRIDGSLQVVEGAIVPEASSLTVQFLDADRAPWDDGDDMTSSACTFDVATVSGGPEEELEGEPLLTWWQLDAVPPADDGPACGWEVPVPMTAMATDNIPVVVGIGAFDPRLRPSLDAAGYASNLDLYGLYLLHPDAQDGDTVFVFGVAGTDEQFAGTDSAVEAPPLPDATYELRSTILLPVPGSPGW